MGGRIPVLTCARQRAASATSRVISISARIRARRCSCRAASAMRAVLIRLGDPPSLRERGLACQGEAVRPGSNPSSPSLRYRYAGTLRLRLPVAAPREAEGEAWCPEEDSNLHAL